MLYLPFWPGKNGRSRSKRCTNARGDVHCIFKVFLADLLNLTQLMSYKCCVPQLGLLPSSYTSCLLNESSSLSPATKSGERFINRGSDFTLHFVQRPQLLEQPLTCEQKHPHLSAASCRWAQSCFSPCHVRMLSVLSPCWKRGHSARWIQTISAPDNEEQLFLQDSYLCEWTGNKRVPKEFLEAQKLRNFHQLS